MFCRFTDITREKIAEHYLFCKQFGVDAILHREALVAKKIEGSGENDTTFATLLQVVVKMIPLSQRYSRKMLALLTIFEAMQKNAGYSLSCVNKWMRFSQNCFCIRKYNGSPEAEFLAVSFC